MDWMNVWIQIMSRVSTVALAYLCFQSCPLLQCLIWRSCSVVSVSPGPKQVLAASSMTLIIIASQSSLHSSLNHACDADCVAWVTDFIHAHCSVYCCLPMFLLLLCLICLLGVLVSPRLEHFLAITFWQCFKCIYRGTPFYFQWELKPMCSIVWFLFSVPTLLWIVHLAAPCLGCHVPWICQPNWLTYNAPVHYNQLAISDDPFHPVSLFPSDFDLPCRGRGAWTRLLPRDQKIKNVSQCRWEEDLTTR